MKFASESVKSKVPGRQQYEDKCPTSRWKFRIDAEESSQVTVSDLFSLVILRIMFSIVLYIEQSTFPPFSHFTRTTALQE